jgi:iron complex outermembrane recepter protein
MKKILAVLSFTISFITTWAQGTVAGTTKDEKNQPLEFANVVIYKLPDSVQVSGTLTDQQGVFSFEDIKHGQYYIVISYVGYEKTFSKPFLLTKAQPSIKLALIVRESDAALEAVTILAKRPFVEIQPDKTIVNVEQGVMNAGISTAEILKRAPGVTVDKDGALKLKGRDGVMVMLNDKPLYMDDKQIGTLLKSLPADQIKSIEVITNPSAKYDAAGNAGIINIQLKKGALEGFHGSANFSYSQGVFPKTNGGVNLNYKKEKLSLTVGYQLNWRKNLDEWTIDRFYAPSNTTNRFLTENSYNSPGLNNNLNVNGDYSFDEKNSLLFVANGNHYTGDWLGGSTSTIWDQSSIVAERLRSVENSSEKFISGNVGTTYTHTFDTTGTKLSVAANFSRFDQNNTQNMVTNYLISGTPPFSFTSRVPVAVDQQNYQVDFIKHFSKKMKWEVGAKYINVDSRSRVGSVASQADRDSVQNNFFDYRESISALYAMAYYATKKFDFKAGLRYEHTLGKGDQISQSKQFTRDYENFFPSAGITYKQSEQTSYSLTYGRRIDRPDYSDLNPFVYYTDPFNIYAGNALLLPQVTDNVELSYNLFYGGLSFILNYGYTTRPMGVVYRLNPQTLTTTFTSDNLKSFENMGASLAINVPVSKRWTTSNYAYVYQNRFRGDIGFGELDNRMVSFLANSTQNFKLAKGIDVELSAQYESPSAYALSRYNELWQISLGVQKSVFKEKASIKLAANDLFWTYVYRGEQQQEDNTTRDLFRWDNRVVTLTFVYNFGKKVFLQKQEKEDEDQAPNGGRIRMR